jgi:hypothetical protein
LLKGYEGAKPSGEEVAAKPMPEGVRIRVESLSTWALRTAAKRRKAKHSREAAVPDATKIEKPPPMPAPKAESPQATVSDGNIPSEPQSGETATAPDDAGGVLTAPEIRSAPDEAPMPEKQPRIIPR